MAIDYVSWALAQRGIDDHVKVTLIALANRARSGAGCWPRIETIAADTSKSIATVKRHLLELCEKGLISRKRSNYFNTYTLLADSSSGEPSKIASDSSSGEPSDENADSSPCELPDSSSGELQKEKKEISFFTNVQKDNARDARLLSDEQENEFDMVWREFPNIRTASKLKAKRAYFKKIREKDKVNFFLAVAAYAEDIAERKKKRSDVAIMHMSTFINEERWLNFVPQKEAAE